MNKFVSQPQSTSNLTKTFILVLKIFNMPTNSRRKSRALQKRLATDTSVLNVKVCKDEQEKGALGFRREKEDRKYVTQTPVNF